MDKKETIARFMSSIMGNESGGDYNLPNQSGSGCTGAYQFCQETWDTYAETAAPEYVGVNPMNCPPDVQDAVMYAKTSAMYDRYGGDVRLMALEHYAGSGTADYAMETGYISDEPNYTNGDRYPSNLEYVTDIANRMGSAVPTFGGMYSAVDRSGIHTAGNPDFSIIFDESPIAQTRLDGRSFTEKLLDSFQNMWYENGTISAMRTGLVKLGTGNPYIKNWKPSDDDIKLLDEVLGDNSVAKNSVLLNAENPEQFKALMNMKKEDIERAERAEKTSFGLHSVLGGGLGLILDPLNFIPFIGPEAFVAKVGTRLGAKALVSIGSKRIVKIAESAAAQGVLNMGDSFLSERYGIHEANYAVAGLLGTAGGAGAKFLRTARALNVNTTGEHMKRFAYQADRMETQAVRGALDIADKMSIQRDTAFKTTSNLAHRIKDTVVSVSSSTKRTKTKTAALDSVLKKYKEEESVSKLLGNHASELLESANLPKDSTMSDLLNVASSNADLNSKVRKAFEETTGTPVSDSTWTAYMNYKGSEPNQVTQLAMDALKDDEKARVLQETLKMGTGEDIPADELRKSLKQVLYNDSGVTYTKDGEIVINGSVVRKGNPVYDAIVNPEIYDPKFVDDVPMGFKTHREVEQETQKGFKSRVMQYIGRKLEDSKFLGDTYGHFTNSVSNHLRDFGKKMLGDPRQSSARKAEGYTLDFSTRKSVMHRDLRNYVSAMAQCYRDYFSSHIGTPSAVRREFGKKFIEAYDSKVKYGKDLSGYPKEIQEAVKLAQEFRKAEQHYLKKTGVLTDDIMDTGFYRNADVDKVAEFITQFDTEQDAIDWLAHYAKTNADTEVLERLWTKEESELPFADFAEQEARNWAYGIIDRNLSNAKVTMRDLNHMDKLEQYQRRFPMDTSALSDRTLPNGEYFSFDECLRDYDVFRTMEQVANRSSAKATMASLGVKDMGAFFDGYRDKIERELRKANEIGRVINSSDVVDAMEEFDYVVSNLTGYRYGTKKAQDPMGGVMKLLTKLSYTMNGTNMGLNQIGENFGMMSVTGVRALGNMIPNLDKFLHKMRTTTLTHDELVKLRIGGDYAHYNFLNPMELSLPQYERIGLRAKVMGKLNTAVDYASDVTSVLNQLSAWTNKAVSMGEADVMSDLVDWAVLGRSGKLFTKDAFKNVGVHDVDKFKDTIYKYFGNLDHDDTDAVFKAIQKMQEDDYASYVSMRAFTAQAVQRGIIQPTISNSNYFTKKGLYPLLFQFKNFSRMAINSHLARALERPDKEVMTQLMSSGIAGASIWALRTQVYANWKYKNEEERKAFLDKTLTTDNFARAGITRSSLLAGLSFGNDFYEAVSGSPTVRTTVNKQGGANQGIGSSFVDQLPAISSLNTVLSGTSSVWSALNDLVQDHKVYQDDSKTVANMFPLDKFVGTQLVLSGLLDIHKDEISKENFGKRPASKPSRNPIQMLKEAVVGVDEEEKPKQKKKDMLIKMNGGKW